MSTKTARQVIEITEELKNRFYSKTVRAENGCMIWIGCVSKNGYGKFKLVDGPQDSHVVSWRIANNGKTVPTGKCVMHSCDCRLCVNPQHLSIGTTSENMRDAHEKQRIDDFLCRGEDSPNHVLTEKIVSEIKRDYRPRKMSYRKLAKRYGVCSGTVQAVLEGRTWKHVKAAEGE